MKRHSFLLLIIGTVMIAGCATQSARKEELLYWPSPPEEPRIAYIKSTTGEADFQKISFWDRIFGRPAAPRLRKPAGVFAHGNRIYVTQTDAGTVAVMDEVEQKVTFLGDSGPGKLDTPIGIAGTADGKLIFVADAKLKKVYGYDQEGNLLVAVGKKDEFENPVGVAVNNDLKRLYVLDSHEDAVFVYTLQGEQLLRFGKRGEQDGEFHFPFGIAINQRTGNVYVVDTQNFRVQVFDKDGKFLSKFGGSGDAPGSFSRPKGVGIDSEGHIYVVDAAFNNFQVFTDDAQLLLYIGGTGGGGGHFLGPAGIFVEDNDRFYIADSLNGRVQVFQYLSDKWKKEHPDEYKKYLLPAEAEKGKP